MEPSIKTFALFAACTMTACSTTAEYRIGRVDYARLESESLQTAHETIAAERADGRLVRIYASSIWGQSLGGASDDARLIPVMTSAYNPRTTAAASTITIGLSTLVAGTALLAVGASASSSGGLGNLVPLAAGGGLAAIGVTGTTVGIVLGATSSNFRPQEAPDLARLSSPPGGRHPLVLGWSWAF